MFKLFYISVLSHSRQTFRKAVLGFVLLWSTMAMKVTDMSFILVMLWFLFCSSQHNNVSVDGGQPF